MFMEINEKLSKKMRIKTLKGNYSLLSPSIFTPKCIYMNGCLRYFQSAETKEPLCAAYFNTRVEVKKKVPKKS